ncbi:MAG: chorismate mutase [Betaproteobacteria bacterium]|nr:chorismate mutase [Betaproteobacteria bacterium]
MTQHTPPSSMAEVRQRVDALDDAIVPLLVARSRCMHDAARIKLHAHEVRDEARIEAIVSRVRPLAEEHGGDPDLMEGLYRQMMECFIAYEAQLFAVKACGTEPPSEVKS